ncbi:MAG: hypothetical protein V4538_03575 [Bacteroidota bacterium]
MNNAQMADNKKVFARLVTWFKRIGVAGFIFFLVKGLLWLIIPYLISKGIF